MPCAPRALLLWDLVLGVVGTGAFLVDLGADLWAASRYVLGGCYVCAALVLGLTGLASGALQLFSWLWLRADPAGLHVWRHPATGLALLHLLQLGYLYRCLQALWQGFLVCRQEVPSEFDLAYADFLALDISMLRLFETFLETTPQLMLVLAIMLRSGHAENFQWFGICSSFVSISWALLDYHRALRTCLPSKPRLGLAASVIYFLWNLLLLWPRVLAVALFAALFPRYVILHFLGLWLVLLCWVWLQDTNFMPDPRSEWLYRATVATILYFSWFNVSEGHTRGRALIHVAFLLSDSVLLLITWWTQRTWLPSEAPLQTVLLVGLGCFLLGQALRLVYYCWLHPSLHWEPDQVDGTLSFKLHPLPQNRRMAQLAHSFFSKVRGQIAFLNKEEDNAVL